MQIKYDIIADAVYMNVSDGKIARTLELEDRLLVDVDAKGHIVGIEILDAGRQGQMVKGLSENVQSGLGVPVEIQQSTPETHSVA